MNSSDGYASNSSTDIRGPTSSDIFVPDFGPFDRMVSEMPLIGYPGPYFYVIHLSAIIGLSLSASVSFVLILYLFIFGVHGKVSKGNQISPAKTTEHAGQGHTSNESSEMGPSLGSQNRISFWKWNFAERLVVYLATVDFGFSSFHLVDKVYYLSRVANPPDGLCTMVGFFFNQFMFSQWIVVMCAAVNACSLVVFNRKLDLGKWDWKLIVIAFGIPFVCGVIEVSLGLLGQAGAWCFIDYRTKAGRTLGQMVGIFELVTFGTLAICYGAIWVKVRQSSKVLDSNVERCNRTAKIMMLFVVTFFFQWWSQMLIVIWAYIFVTIPPFIPIISGTLVSLGGVYDCIVYTVIRRRFQKRVSPT